MRRALPLLLAALAACSVLRNPYAGPAADAWGAARKASTRTAKVYDRFETHAIATAIWQSAEVRARRVAQIATWRAMTAEERQALSAAEAADEARWDEFLVLLFTTDVRTNDLDAKKSIWRVALVRPDGEQLPAEVRAVPVDGELRALYPDIHEYDLVYRVRFPRRPGLGDAPFTLRIAGAEGQMDFPFGPRD